MRRGVRGELLGQYRSAFRGSGLVFSDLREYQPGDDVKHIHWKVTARSGHVFVKSYEEERQLTLIVALDSSNSTLCGEHTSTFKKALEFSALIALLGEDNKDKVGLCVFSNKIERFIPPAHSRGQLQRIIATLIDPPRGEKQTDIRVPLAFLRQQIRRPAILFLVSDFYSPPYERELQTVARRHDVVCVLLDDTVEKAFPNAGIVEFADAETGERFFDRYL